MSEYDSYEDWYDNGPGSVAFNNRVRKSEYDFWKGKSISVLFSGPPSDTNADKKNDEPICEEKKPREILNKGISVITQLIGEANEYYRKKYGKPRKVEYDLPGNRLVSSLKSQNVYLWWTFCKGFRQDQNTGSDYFLVWGSLGESGMGQGAMRSLFLFKGTTSMLHKHLTPKTLDEWEKIIMREF